ncbi:MAG TPA: polysaccharide biosynthesis/export family protein [Chthoniobacteraceae bacterium]|jgi:protein involved in polysaccharide export with SLBB domain|nr:polysaccharide biosynthesis/export family protein [Chthoniobacteraceae bacterium]
MLRSFIPFFLSLALGAAWAADPIRLDPQAAAAAAASRTIPASLTSSMDVLDDTRPLTIGDKVSLRVVEEHKPAIEAYVTDSGDLEVPLIGRVKARGKTCKALAREIKTALDKEYFYHCNVILGLDTASTRSRGKIYLTGPVKQQGAMELPANEQLTLSRAIMAAGGFSDFANKKKVKVVRKDASGKEQTFVVDVAQILEKGKTAADLVLQPEDVIIVSARLVNL